MIWDFKYSYDQENDDLFLYLDSSKSKGSIELGNFVFDLDENNNLVGMQIFEASQILSKVLTDLTELTNIKEIRIETNNFRNMQVIKIHLTTSSGKSEGIIALPDFNSESPALSY